MKRAKKINDNKIDYGTISIPIPLINKIKERIKGTGMASVSAYVSFVLRQILSAPSKDFTKKEIEEVKARLKSLGYYKL